MTLFLVDNGSLRAASTLQLRAVAAAATALGVRVEPVSLLHSAAVPADELGGQPAQLLEHAVVHRVEAGEREFGVVPFFLGPSRAVTEYIPERAAALARRYPGLRVRVGRPLVDVTDAADPGGAMIADVLAERVRAARPAGARTPVALVDHGSPEPRVTAVRDHLAGLLRERLGTEAVAVTACAMERREGPEYAFNDPLLERLLGTPPFYVGEVVVALLFLAPGRHAGPRGDVARICREAEERREGLRTILTAPVGSHPAVHALVARRAAELAG